MLVSRSLKASNSYSIIIIILDSDLMRADRSELSVPEFPGPLPEDATLATQDLHIAQTVELCVQVMKSDAPNSDKAMNLGELIAGGACPKC